MNLSAVLIFCIIACVLILILKQYQKAYGMLLSIVVCVAVLLLLLPQAERILQTAEHIYLQTGLDNSYFILLCKAIGISYLTQLGTDICKDCGESAIGTAVELCGRMVLVLLALPLFLTLSEMILELL